MRKCWRTFSPDPRSLLLWTNCEGVSPVASVVSDSQTVWTAPCQAPLSMGFSRQKYLLLLLSCSVTSAYAIPWTAAHQASLSFTISWCLLKLMPIELMMPSNHLIFCCLLLLSSIFPSIRSFSNELALCIKWTKYWSFSISPSNGY